ncbi:MAG: glycosyltransferase, partial [Verrucomicrobiota bacterium]|nr:glycosyltransferase [Verrucomicrobiota bacterium]
FFANTVITTNQSVYEIAIGRGNKNNKDVFIVRSAPKIPTGQIKPNSALKKNRNYLIGYVGVMGSADGIDRIIKAADYLINELGRRDIQFLLMGFGPEYENLIHLRDELGLKDFIDLPGRVEGVELFSALSTMDLGVSGDPINPYNNHCTMNKVLEYMAMGKPQVTYDLKESRYSAGEAAIYVNEVSSQSLGQAIANLIDDPELRKKMGHIGHERFHSNLNWEKSVQQLKAAYSSTLDNH